MYDRFQAARLIDGWLAEDIGHGDLTAQLMIDAGQQGAFEMRARQTALLAGIDVAAAVFARYDPALMIEVRMTDGAQLCAGDCLLRVSGSARSIFTAERTALNIVQHLSAIATQTARYVAAIGTARGRLLDTRKTTPGLRMLEKHAVACGGGLNHRLGLDSGVMLKDNHIAVCGGIRAAVERARRQLPVLTRIEVECDRLEQVDEALAAGVDVLMLDNMPLDQMCEAVRRCAGQTLVEASGGITLETIGAVAATGVDYLSTSKITQGAGTVDIGLDACT